MSRTSNRRYGLWWRGTAYRIAIRFHDLRHTFATLQLAAGTNPKIVSEVLGHKEVAISLDRYSHALPGFSFDVRVDWRSRRVATGRGIRFDSAGA